MNKIDLVYGFINISIYSTHPPGKLVFLVDPKNFMSHILFSNVISLQYSLDGLIFKKGISLTYQEECESKLCFL